MWDKILQLKDPIIFLVVGMYLLIKGADWFVDGASNIAKLLKIPALIIGLTLVSMGTSAPEASVSINASLAGANDISMGNVVGSNIFNVLVVGGCSAIFAPMVIDKEIKLYDIPIMIFISALLVVFSFVTTPLVLNFIESLILVIVFVLYLVFLVVRAKKTDTKQEKEEIKEEKPSALKSLALLVVGLLAIIVGGDWVVVGASDVAKLLGMDEVLIGLTIVAMGTSLPELVTSIVAAKKGENEIAIGNIIGSNVFNILFVLGLASTISSITVNADMLIDTLFMLGTGVALMIISFIRKDIGKKIGIVSILLYFAYLAYIIARNYAF